MRTKLKNVLSGKVVDKTFNAGVKVETATVDRRDMQFSYMDGEYFVFMDMETYDQLMVDRKAVGDAANFLIEGFDGHRRAARGRGALRRAAGRRRARHPGDRARASRATAPPVAPSPPRWRPATQIQVPLFITTGEKIKVDTRTGDYLGRVNS